MSKAINVVDTHAATKNLSRAALLSWVNDTLHTKFFKIEDLCTGTAYCQIMDLLFPNSVNLLKVRFTTNHEFEFVENFKILQAAFQKVSVERIVPIEQLAKGRMQDSLEFLQWFHKFYEANLLLNIQSPDSRGTAPQIDKIQEVPDSTGTERVPGRPVKTKFDLVELERKIKELELRNEFYRGKCLQIEKLCQQPQGLTCQKIYDILNASQHGLSYPPRE